MLPGREAAETRPGPGPCPGPAGASRVPPRPPHFAPPAETRVTPWRRWEPSSASPRRPATCSRRAPLPAAPLSGETARARPALPLRRRRVRALPNRGGAAALARSFRSGEKVRRACRAAAGAGPPRRGAGSTYCVGAGRGRRRLLGAGGGSGGSGAGEAVRARRRQPRLPPGRGAGRGDGGRERGGSARRRSRRGGKAGQPSAAVSPAPAAGGRPRGQCPPARRANTRWRRGGLNTHSPGAGSWGPALLCVFSGCATDGGVTVIARVSPQTPSSFALPRCI